ncbi:tetraacyldisaccharide 4'-kinase [Candidatus Babeliales bacterium]|nr:tetraacyldisaccharide 4'-kinase [Candidatus Babeliales bacterium]
MRKKKFFFNIILCFFEIFYKIGFLVVIFFKKKFGSSKIFPFRVISVGNLSVGGTGKSVFVFYLINNLKRFNCAVVLRGYKGQNEKNLSSFLVCDGKNIFCEAFFCGDEAYMFAYMLNVPVVVGSSRLKSCNLLEKFIFNDDKKIDVVVLDDAYQNFHVKKDCQILLLDAKFPFSNGHCLPAGRLREKNYSRADFIILTRADRVNLEVLNKIKTEMLCDFDQQSIFFAKHKIGNVSRLNLHNIDHEKIKGKKFFVVAAIASFEYFVESVKKLGVSLFDVKEYRDHYNYKIKDIIFCLEVVKNNQLDGIITTQKDWVKIFPVIRKMSGWENFPFYILDVSFEFLSKKEHDFFLKKLEEKLKQ